MRVIAWNRFNGFYVVSDNPDSFDGLRFHYWAKTVEECREWISEKRN